MLSLLGVIVLLHGPGFTFFRSLKNGFDFSALYQLYSLK